MRGSHRAVDFLLCDHEVIRNHVLQSSNTGLRLLSSTLMILKNQLHLTSCSYRNLTYHTNSQHQLVTPYMMPHPNTQNNRHRFHRKDSTQSIKHITPFNATLSPCNVSLAPIFPSEFTSTSKGALIHRKWFSTFYALL